MQKLTFASNSLIVLCGPAGCGKSYFAGKFFRPSQVVSSDDCRRMISDDAANQRVSPDAFELMTRIIEYRLKYNRLALADATHLISGTRRPLLELAQQYRRPIHLVVFEVDLETCLRQNGLRDRKVDPEVIEAQMPKYRTALEQIPTEPYTSIFYLQPKQTDDLVIEFTQAVPDHEPPG